MCYFLGARYGLNDIEVDSVTKRFEDMRAVDDLSTSVAKGRTVRLAGSQWRGQVHYHKDDFWDDKSNLWHNQSGKL